MIREEIKNMKPGRELDVLLAKSMGYEVVWRKWPKNWEEWEPWEDPMPPGSGPVECNPKDKGAFPVMVGG